MSDKMQRYSGCEAEAYEPTRKVWIYEQDYAAERKMLLDALRDFLKYSPLSGDMAMMIRACQGGGNEAADRADKLIEHYSHIDAVQEQARALLAERKEKEHAE
jgi:hypothetical protein